MTRPGQRTKTPAWEEAFPCGCFPLPGFPAWIYYDSYSARYFVEEVLFQVNYRTGYYNGP